MKRLIGLLRKRWLVTLVGVVALSLLVWFVGPLVAVADAVPLAGVTARVLLIAVLFALWAIALLVARLRAARANRQILSAGDGEEAGDGTLPAEEVAQLRERFAEAAKILRSAKLAKGGDRQYLYELPWYIIIGPPGSGKTTALANSGLEFPLAERFGRNALRGVGGTRNCDWWFTDDAVMIDTAGRYTTQDSHGAADGAAWSGFLDLLKRYRRRRPINGVFVTVSVADLLVQSEEQRALHSRAIRARIEELQERLGIDFPIYALFTKSDLIPGFTEFFDDLGKDEREQVWGVTFPLDGEEVALDGVVTRFGEAFDALWERVNGRLVTRLHQERDPRRRSLIFGFPQQLANLKGVMDDFLQETFRVNRFQHRPLLRGVYLTSGTQEGAPIDRLMGALAQAFGLGRYALPSFTGQGRSYFITRLFRDLAFAEAELVGGNAHRERLRAWLQRGAYGGALAIAAAAALAWSGSFTGNQLYVGRMADGLAAFHDKAPALRPPAAGERADFARLVPPLGDLRGVDGVYAEYHEEGPPLLLRLGLYQGGRLAPEAREAYRRVLNGPFLETVAKRLEEQLASGVEDVEFLHEALKLYLMLGSPERLDRPLLSGWMDLDWQQRHAADGATQGALKSHLATLLDGPVRALDLDDGVVRRARELIRRQPLAQRVYLRFKREAVDARRYGFTLGEVLGPAGDELFDASRGEEPGTRRVPGLFTIDGYQRVFLKDRVRLIEQALADDWVMGEEEGTLSDDERERLDVEVARLYYAEYVDYWKGLLGELAIAESSGSQGTLRLVELASAPDSPLRRLLALTERNTALTRVGEEGLGTLTTGLDAAGAVTAGSSALETKRQRLQRIARLAGKSGVADAVARRLPGREVEEPFEPLAREVRAAEGGVPPIDRVTAQLGELYAYLSEVTGDGVTALRAATAGGRGGVVGRLRNTASHKPEPLKRWLTALADAAWGGVVGQGQGYLNAMWRARVLPECRRALEGRYPMRDAKEEVTLADFSHFFAPGGTLERFQREYLEGVIDTSRGRWRTRPGGPRLSAAALAQLQRAERIRRLFFADGSTTPKVRFKVRPEKLDPHVYRALLDVDGQQLIYSHGPLEVRGMSWPGNDGSERVRVVLTDSRGVETVIQADGPWAWFRLLDGAKLEKETSAERFLVTFDKEGREARYRLWADSVVNPFDPGALKGFECRDRL